jgi:hypothetical protein
MSSEAEASLAAALQNLNIAWQETRMYWRDAKCLEFEERYLKELPGLVAQAGRMIGELETVLKKVRNDCE